MLLWLFIGIVVGMVLILTLLNPEKGIREWVSRYWARMLSLIMGIATITGIVMHNLPMSIVSALALTVLVFRGYDQEIEEEITVTEKIVESKPEPEKKTIVIDSDKFKSKNGKLYIEEGG